MRNPRVLCNIHGNSPSGFRPRARACIFHKTLGLMLYLLHTCTYQYIEFLCVWKHLCGILMPAICPLLIGWLVRVSEELAVSGKYLWCSWHTAATPQWSQDVCTSGQVMEGHNETSAQESKLHSSWNKTRYMYAGILIGINNSRPCQFPSK